MKSVIKTLWEVQKRARVRYITADHIELMREKLTARFSHCTKKDLDGITFIADFHAQSFPSSYRGVPESTLIIFEHKRGSWRVIKIWRGETRKNQFSLLSGTELLAKALVNAASSF